MRISDWSSDVCSSDLPEPIGIGRDLVLGIDRGDRILKVADRRDRRFADQVGDAGGVVLADRMAAIDHDLDVQAVALEPQIVACTDDQLRGIENGSASWGGRVGPIGYDVGVPGSLEKRKKENT